MNAKYEVFISYGSKVIPVAKVKVDNRQTNKQTDPISLSLTHKQTDKQTDQKQYAPDHSIRAGGTKYCINRVYISICDILLITTNNCVLKFYDLSVWDEFWSLVSLHNRCEKWESWALKH